MCIDQYEYCPYCHYENHIHWVWCRPYLINLVTHMKEFREPLPKPDDCPSIVRQKKMVLGILTCPVDACETTQLVPGRLAEIAEELAELRAAYRRAQEKIEARRKRFAERWFNRRPVVPPSRRSLLTEGIKQIESLPHTLVHTDASMEGLNVKPSDYDIGTIWPRNTWFSWTTLSFPSLEDRFE
ncbi:hypothetical protein HJFPF1_01290 [Paramyrothecium foliicola]|nr:hypothetical protein HJFPF1_01290 [Paramyrothecium foliicola]